MGRRWKEEKGGLRKNEKTENVDEGKKIFEKYFVKKDKEGGGVEEGWERLKKRVRETVKKVEREIKEGKKSGW